MATRKPRPSEREADSSIDGIDDEVREFRTEFGPIDDAPVESSETTGVPSETESDATSPSEQRHASEQSLHDTDRKMRQVVRALSQKSREQATLLHTEIKAREHLERALTLTLDTLKVDNARLKSYVEDRWKLPKFAFMIVTSLAGIFFGVNLAYELMTTVEVRERTEEIENKVAATAASLVEVENSLKVFSTELAMASTEARETVLDAVSPVAAAHRAVAYTSLARFHLSHENDLARSKYYTDQATAQVNTALRSLEESDGNDSVRSMLQEIEPVVWAVEAERLFNERDFLKLHEKSRLLTDRQCSCVEGHLFHGIANLYMYLDQVGGLERDTPTLQTAVDSLTAAAELEGSNGFSQILRASALLHMGMPQLAQAACGGYLKNRPVLAGPEFERLPASGRAKISLASALNRIAHATGTVGPAVETPMRCEIDAGAIGPAYGLLFEMVFAGIAKNRRQFAADPRTANLIGLYCADIVLSVRRSCSDPGCASGTCGSPDIGDGTPARLADHAVSQPFAELAAKWRLAPMPYYLFTSDTENLSFTPKEFEIVYSRPEIRTVEETYTVVVGEYQEERVRLVELPVFVDATWNVDATNTPSNRWALRLPDFLAQSDIESFRQSLQRGLETQTPAPAPSPVEEEAPVPPAAMDETFGATEQEVDNTVPAPAPPDF